MTDLKNLKRRAREILSTSGTVSLTFQLIQDLANLPDEPEEKKEGWLKIGDKYWTLNPIGQTATDTWINSWVDLGRKRFGNVFRSDVEAEAHRARLKKLARHPELRELVDRWPRVDLAEDWDSQAGGPT